MLVNDVKYFLPTLFEENVKSSNMTETSILSVQDINMCALYDNISPKKQMYESISDKIYSSKLFNT